MPAVVSAFTNPHPSASGHAHMLAAHWVTAVQQLDSCLADIMDPSAFTLVRFNILLYSITIHSSKISVCQLHMTLAVIHQKTTKVDQHRLLELARVRGTEICGQEQLPTIHKYKQNMDLKFLMT